MKKHLLLLSLAASAVLADTFTLGQINVLTTPIEESPFEQTLTSEVIAQQNSENLPDALDNMSGVTKQYMGGGRNEAYISIRGQDSKRVGVFIDGVPVYVPYDGNFDANRFLTGDIAQIDVAKGFSSVAYGANTLGGVINVITKKPTKVFEGEIKGGFVLDSDTDLSRRVASLNLGTKQDHVYAQLSASYADQNHFRLSDDYTPSTSNIIQREGNRLRSATNDHKVNIKTGYVANDGSEIALGYSNQMGQKEVSPSTASTSLAGKDRWTWPYWDKETIYLTGQKNFGSSYLKSSLYYDKSQNSLDFNYLVANNYTTNNTGASRYDDYAYGGRLEYGSELGNHFLTASANYKKDVHRGYTINEASDTEYLSDNFKDNTLSLGLEDIYTLSSQWQVVAGIGYDRKEGDSGWDLATGSFPMGSQDAISPEIALVYSLDSSSKIRGSIAQKTYLPSMKDRYTRTVTGTKLPNPSLAAETATHYELSYQKHLGTLSSKIAGFYTRVNDAIQSITIDDLGTTSTSDDITQNQNYGTVDRRGIELDLKYKGEMFETGGNYTFIAAKNKTKPTEVVWDVPKHEAFAYSQIDFGHGLSVYGDIKFRKGAHESNTVILPTFAVYDLKAVYKATENITAEVGIKNVTDKLVIYDVGYPNAGREFFANLGYKF